MCKITFYIYKIEIIKNPKKKSENPLKIPKPPFFFNPGVLPAMPVSGTDGKGKNSYLWLRPDPQHLLK